MKEVPSHTILTLHNTVSVLRLYWTLKVCQIMTVGTSIHNNCIIMAPGGDSTICRMHSRGQLLCMCTVVSHVISLYTCLKLFRAYSGYIRHETFSFMMSLLAMSLGLRFCASRKGGARGGGWVHPKGAKSMAASGLVFRSNLVSTGRAISVLCRINGGRNKQSHLVGPPFLEFKAHFQLWQVGISRET